MSVVLKTQAQKVLEKTVDASQLTTLIIEDDILFNIKMKTGTTNQIKIRTKFEGEASEHLVLTTVTTADTLSVSTTFQPLYLAYNDKLSAHKVLSVEMEIEIPESLTVYLNSTQASVAMQGRYKHVMLELRQGHCKITDFQGQALVNTIHGHIEVYANYAIVDMFSRSGRISREPIQQGNTHIKIRSHNGNISLYSTKK